MPPTLLKRGALRYTGYGLKQELLDTHVPIEYILSIFEKKLASKPTSPADRIFMILSTTGTGKSTVLPVYIYYKFALKTGKIVGITQPRVMTAKSIPIDVSITYGAKALRERGDSRPAMVLGENLGFKTHYFKVVPKEGVIYMTCGTLLQQFNTLSDEEMMDKYSFIIIDEAHTLSPDIVNTIEAAKKFVYRNYMNAKCPFIILTTGTFDIKYYTDYMLSGIEDRYLNMINVQGSSYRRDEIFLKYNSTNMYNSTIKTILNIHLDNSADVGEPVDEKLITSTRKYIDKHLVDGGDDPMIDVLVFISGQEGMLIDSKMAKLTDTLEYLKKYPYRWLLINRKAVNSENKDYIDTYTPLSKIKVKINGEMVPAKRRLIIATNVAETGLTLPALKYVIDMGWVQESTIDPTFGVAIMLIAPVTKDSHTQRLGRIGRLAPGVCYTMFTEECFNTMRDSGYPPSVKSDITLDLLSTIIREIDTKGEVNMSSPKMLRNKKLKANLNILGLDLLFKSPIDMYSYALEKLFVLGAIDSNSMPTLTGFIMNKIRMVSPECIRFILAGLAYKLSMSFIINMAVLISEDMVFNMVKDDSTILPNVMFMNSNAKYKEMTKLYRVVADPFIYSALILTNILESDNIYNRSKELGIVFTNLTALLKRRDELISNLASIGINALGNYRDMISYRSIYEFVCQIKLCVYEGYRMNLCVWNGKEYKDRRTGMPLAIKSNLLFSDNEISVLGEDNPQVILHYGLQFTQSRSSIYYELDKKKTKISIMTGYVPVDLHYDLI